MALAISVPDAPAAGHDALTPDVTDRLILVNYEDDVRFPFHVRILWVSLGGSRWMVSTPTRDTFEEDFSGEYIIPLTRASQHPIGNRPIFSFGDITPLQYSEMRNTAFAMAQVLGHVPAVIDIPVGEASWVFADSSLASFGCVADAALISNPARCHLQDAVGIVEADEGLGRQWKTVERVRLSDLLRWKQEKQTGSGRHPLLLPITVDPKNPPLFRETCLESAPSVPLLAAFRGPSARRELMQAIVASGGEPPAYAAAWLTASGVAPRSSVALEFVMQVHAFWMLATLDGIDLNNSATAEHLARRILQIQRAVRRAPRSPDFSGLEAYVEHVSMTSLGAPTPEFDRHVAEIQKVEAQIMKSQRLSQEETNAANKGRKEQHEKEKNNNNNKKKDKKAEKEGVDE
jgi:hypothetical protein